MEPLSDPKGDRTVKSVKPPPHKPLYRNLIWPNNSSKPNWKIIRDNLAKEGRIEKQDFLKLVTDCNRIFKSEGNLLQLQDPLTVVGDIHGQFYDLLKILEVGGNPSNTKYLFLGDFVDRGSFSIEVLILLYAIKINFPDTVYFLRGNHECRQMTSFFNFKDECKYKYDQEVYEILMDSFDLIPLACVVNGKFLALHGGISPEIKSLEDIKKVDRFKEPPRQGIFCDMLWADPVDNDDGVCENIYRPNEVRGLHYLFPGCSYFYGIDAVKRFLDSTNLISVIRAHEAQLEGYKMHRWNGGQDFPAVITIFSAPNYCDVYNNKGAVIKFEQFNYTQHPYLLPHFMDIFTWSIPFVAEKISEMFYHILKPNQNDEISDEEDEQFNKKDIQKIQKMIPGKDDGGSTQVETDPNGGGEKKKADVLRNKIKFISKMMKFQKTLRQESESIMKLKGQCPDKRIPQGLLSEGGGAIQNAIESFKKARSADLVNEKRPEFTGPSLKNKQSQVKSKK